MKRRTRTITLILIALLIPASIEMSARVFAPRTPWLVLLHERQPEAYTVTTNGERRTLWQPDRATHDVWMFGSSTLLGITNPDGATIPSQLQRILPSYRVHNMGWRGANATVMTGVLKQTRLKPGDVVVFYAGQTDLIGTARAVDAEQFDLCRYLLMNANDIITVHWLCDNNLHPASLTSAALDDTLAHYNRAIAAGRQYARAKGATFYNVLEPVKGTLPETADELMFRNYEPHFVTADAIYPAVYAAFRQTGAIDISHVLDDMRRAGVSVYADNMHTTDEANAVIARAIYRAIWQTF